MISRLKRARPPQGELAALESKSEHDHEFLRRLQEWDDAAWQQFTEEWNSKLYSYLKYNLRDDSEVDDVLMEIMSSLIQAIRTFDGKVSLSTFVYSIAYRKVADYWRRLRADVELMEWMTADEIDHTRIEVYEALAELPEQSKQALLLRYYAGLSVGEIAEVLGRSYKGTESLLSRVRRQFETAFMNGAEA
jgi:RNA polymerase sigma-70 factor (ECF subfamily)